LWNLPNESTSISDDDVSLDIISGSVAQEVAYVTEHLCLSIILVEEEASARYWSPTFMVSTCKFADIISVQKKQRETN
jgi:hypothetical protein